MIKKLNSYSKDDLQDLYDEYEIRSPLQRLVFDYMIEFWQGVENNKKLSKRSLSKIIHTEHPDLFADPEDVRDIIRYLTKSRGNVSANRPDIEFSPQESNPLGLTNSFSYNQGAIFELPEKDDNILLISDVQAPFHDVPALNVALDYGIKNGVNTIYINGDFMDWYGISRFETDPRLRKLKLEYYTGVELLKDIRLLYPDAEIYYKMGNHDVRWAKYLWNNAPLITGIADLEFASVMGLKAMNIHLIEDKTETRAGKLSIIHGHEVYGGSPVNPARGFYMRYNGNIIGGHHHRTSHHMAKTGRGDYHGAWSVGCLCQMRPEFSVVNQWNHGFANITWKDDEFEVKNFAIINNKAVVN